MFGDEGANAMAPTFKLLIESVRFLHVSPLSVVFQTPPLFATAYMVPVAVGCTASEFMRPAPFDGPADTQVVAAAVCRGPIRYLIASLNWYSSRTLFNCNFGSTSG